MGLRFRFGLLRALASEWGYEELRVGGCLEFGVPAYLVQSKA